MPDHSTIYFIYSHEHARNHVHATIDRLASEQASSLSVVVGIDQQSMNELGGAEGSLVRLSTDRGRSLLARLSDKVTRAPRMTGPKTGNISTPSRASFYII